VGGGVGPVGRGGQGRGEKLAKEEKKELEKVRILKG